MENRARDDRDPGRARLRAIIAERCFKEGDFVLASGRKSNVFFNLKPAMLDPEAINLIADALLAELADVEAGFIGGMVMGAVPLLMAAVVKSAETGRPLKGFWVRKEQKGYGMKQRLDGDLKPGDRVIVVEDVTTTGGSILQSIREVEALGCTVARAVTVIDRCEGAREALEREGHALAALFTRYDFTDKRPDEA